MTCSSGSQCLMPKKESSHDYQSAARASDLGVFHPLASMSPSATAPAAQTSSKGTVKLKPAVDKPRSPATSDRQGPKPASQSPHSKQRAASAATNGGSGNSDPPSKKITRRASKPIINWFQRKIVGSRTRRVSESEGSVPNLPSTASGTFKGRNRAPSAPSSAAVAARVTINSAPPPPLPSLHTKSNETARTNFRPTETINAISLNEDDESTEYRPSTSTEDEVDRDSRSDNRSFSVALESTWSPTSVLEADEDASVRPLPPSAPPSPSAASFSSASYMSNSHTFRSMAASTKPTTLLSVDLPPIGMAHIAQAPATPVSHLARLVSPTHVRNSSSIGAISTLTGAGGVGTGGIPTFSALPPSPTSSRPSSPRGGTNGTASPVGSNGTIQAPLHTAHHPRNNPRPSSPPLDNASVITLASSAFAIRRPSIRGGLSVTTSTAQDRGDSVSHLLDGDLDSQSHYIPAYDERLGGDLDGAGEGDGEVDLDKDVDASVRALRPRSSRRCSWGSELSGWSARLGGGGMSTSLNRERSLWTTNSMRTGALLAQDDAEDDRDTKDTRSHSTEGEDDITSTENEPAMTSPNDPQQILVQVPVPLVAPEISHDTSLAVTAVPDSASTVDSAENNDTVNTPPTPGSHPSVDTIQTESQITTPAPRPQTPPHLSDDTDKHFAWNPPVVHDDDSSSIAATTDHWVSAPSTPVG